MTGRLLEAVRPALIGRIAPTRTEGSICVACYGGAQGYTDQREAIAPSLYGSATL